MCQDAQGARQEVPLPPHLRRCPSWLHTSTAEERDAVGRPLHPSSPPSQDTWQPPGKHGRRPPLKQHPGSEGMSTPQGPCPPGDSELVAPRLGLFCTVRSFFFFENV